MSYEIRVIIFKLFEKKDEERKEVPQADAAGSRDSLLPSFSCSSISVVGKDCAFSEPSEVSTVSGFVLTKEDS